MGQHSESFYVGVSWPHSAQSGPRVTTWKFTDCGSSRGIHHQQYSTHYTNRQTPTEAPCSLFSSRHQIAAVNDPGHRRFSHVAVLYPNPIINDTSMIPHTIHAFTLHLVSATHHPPTTCRHGVYLLSRRWCGWLVGLLLRLQEATSPRTSPPRSQRLAAPWKRHRSSFESSMGKIYSIRAPIWFG